MWKNIMRTRSKRYCHPTLFPWFLLMCSVEMGNQHGSATFFIRLWNSLSLQSIDCGIFTQERNTPRSLQPRHMNVMAFHITGKSTFIQELVQTNNKGNIKAPHYHYWPFVRSTGHCCEGNPPVTIVRGIHRSPLWGESTGHRCEGNHLSEVSISWRTFEAEWRISASVT